MFVAINDAKERVFANKSLPKEGKYFCPVCGGQVRLRVGDTNAPHFAHITPCTDDFTSDMSDWHREWQELFPMGNREVVISHDGESHRADVRCYGTVIEFQHSPISEAEFMRRNRFYTSAGLQVVWIFDLIDVYTSKRMRCEDEWGNQWSRGGEFRWNYPWRFLSNFSPQDEKNVHIFFQLAPFGNDPKSSDELAYMEKVFWVNPNYKTIWGEFRTSYNICNYAELVEWLKMRWEKRQRKIQSGSKPNATFALSLKGKYVVNGEVVDAADVEAFLRENKPYRIIKVGSWNNPRDIERRLCSDSHQKPKIQDCHCLWGCYHCLAMIESGDKQFIYCQYPTNKGKDYKPKVFRKQDMEPK